MAPENAGHLRNDVREGKRLLRVSDSNAAHGAGEQACNPRYRIQCTGEALRRE